MSFSLPAVHRLIEIDEQGTLKTEHIHAALVLHSPDNDGFVYNQFDRGYYIIDHGQCSLIYKITDDRTLHLVEFTDGDESKNQIIPLTDLKTIIQEIEAWQAKRLEAVNV